MPYLAFNLNDGNEFVFDLLEARLTLGRDSRNDIVIDNTFISGHHAEFLRQSDGSFEVVDLKSSNGTFVNGKRIERARVKGGDRVQFGQLEARFRERAPKGAAPAEKSKGTSSTVTAGGNSKAERQDGRRGDTENVPVSMPKVSAPPADPARPVASLDIAGTETSKISVPSSRMVAPAPPIAPTTVLSPAASKVPAMDPALVKEVESLRAELAKLKLQREAVRDELATETRKRDETISAAAKLEGLRKDITEAEARASKLKQDADQRGATNIKVASGEAAAKTLSATQADVAKAQAELDALQQSIATAKQDAAAREAAKAQALADEQAATAKLAAIGKDVAAAQANLAKLTADGESKASAAEQQAQAKIAAAQAQLEAVRKSVQQAEQRLAEVEQRTLTLQSEAVQLAGARSTAENVTTAIGELEGRRIALDAALQALAGQHAAKHSEVQILMQELTAAKAARDSSLTEHEKIVGDHARLTGIVQQLAATHVEHEATATTLRAQVQAEQQKLAELQQRTAALEALRLQQSEAEAALAQSIARVQAEDKALEQTRANVTAAESDLLAKRKQIREATAKGAEELADIEARVNALQTNEARITEKLRELAGSDGNVSDANQALKFLEEQHATMAAQKASLASSVLALTQEQRERERDLTVRREQGTAQRLLVETLAKRNADAEAKVLELEKRGTDTQQKLDVFLAKLASTETALKQRSTELDAATTQLGTTRSEFDRLSREHQALGISHAEAKAAVAQTQNELSDLTSQLTARRSEAAALEKRVATMTSEGDQLAMKTGSLEATLLALTTSHAHQSQKHQEATAALVATETQLGVKSKELAEATTQAAKLVQSNAALDAKLATHQDIDRRLQLARTDLEGVSKEVQLLTKTCAQLTADKVALEPALAALKQQFESTQSELAKAEIARTDHVKTAQQAIAERDAAQALVQSLNSEAKNIETLLKDKRATLDADVTAKLNAAKEAEAKLAAVQANVNKAEQRLAELHDLEARVATAKTRLQEAEALRLAEEKAMAALASQQEQARRDLAASDSTLAALKAQASEFEQRAQQEHAQHLASVTAIQAQVQGAQLHHANTLEQIESLQRQLDEVRSTSGKVLPLAEMIRDLEGQQRDAMKTLRDAGEKELGMQMRITSLQETATQEAQRIEKLKHDGLQAEANIQRTIDDIHARIKEFERMEQEAITRAEAARKEVAALDVQRAEVARLEEQAKQWQAVDQRFRSQLEELEAKHEVMRRGLATDQGTVLMFAQDLIKRIDLIDILIQRFAGQNGGVDQQLRTLRHSFEDILHQHSVHEFDVQPNTEIDVALRQRIAVIESETGDGKPRIAASYRPGFVYSPPDGREVVLRKVEVKTSSR